MHIYYIWSVCIHTCAHACLGMCVDEKTTFRSLFSLFMVGSDDWIQVLRVSRAFMTNDFTNHLSSSNFMNYILHCLS